MNTIQEIFTNRELAIILWGFIILIYVFFSQKRRQSFVDLIKSLMHKILIPFYVIYTIYFSFIIYMLYRVGLWDISLLKDTVIWGLFVMLPLFFTAITEAMDTKYFKKLILGSVSLLVIIEFIFNFWAFNLIIEMMLVPILFWLGALLHLSSINKKDKSLNNLIYAIIFLYIFINGIFVVKNIFLEPHSIINIQSFKELLLPLILLIFNLPALYGFLIYAHYQELYFFLKCHTKEKQFGEIIKIAKFSLKKIFLINQNKSKFLMPNDGTMTPKVNINSLATYFDHQIGENYMKKTNINKKWGMTGLFIFVIIIILTNTTFLNTYSKTIITCLCVIGVLFFLCFFVHSKKAEKKDFQNIARTKIFLFENFIIQLRKQYHNINTDISIENPDDLLLNYILPTTSLLPECKKIFKLYENLLSGREYATINTLKTAIPSFLLVFNDANEIISQEDRKAFVQYYQKEVNNPKNKYDENSNIFIDEINKGFASYKKAILDANNEFEIYYKEISKFLEKQ